MRQSIFIYREKAKGEPGKNGKKPSCLPQTLGYKPGRLQGPVDGESGRRKRGPGGIQLVVSVMKGHLETSRVADLLSLCRMGAQQLSGSLNTDHFVGVGGRHLDVDVTR